MQRRFEAVIVSDLHLGAQNSRAEEFLRFLDSVAFDRLVIAGDLFDSPRLRGLRQEHLKVLEKLRRLSLFQEVVWVRGNHDPEADFARAVLGLEMVSECAVRSGGRTYLVRHGDGWDDSLRLPYWLVSGADACYRASQWLDPSHGLARRLKHGCKKFCRAVEELMLRAVAEAKSLGYQGVIVGHTHTGADREVDGLHYLNAGCWTERPAGFVGIHRDRIAHYLWEADGARRRLEAAEAVCRVEVGGESGAVPALASMAAVNA